MPPPSSTFQNDNNFQLDRSLANTTPAFDLRKPPRLTWSKQKADRFVFGSYMVSGTSIIAIIFALMWTIGFRFTALPNTYDLAFETLEKLGWGGSFIVLLVLGVPWWLALRSIIGKVTLTIDATHLHLYTGFVIGRSQKVALCNIKSVFVKEMPKGNKQKHVAINTITETITFGLDIEKSRVQYLSDALNTCLQEHTKGMPLLGLDLSQHLIQK